MSALQRIHARTMLSVDREIADVLRLEAKKVAMFEHDLFEDFLDFSPGAQYGLALRYATSSISSTSSAGTPRPSTAPSAGSWCP
jgi:hypothetical protein